MNLPDCEHGVPLSDCLACCFATLKQAWANNAALHRRTQGIESAALQNHEIKRQLTILQHVLSERKRELDSLGIAWSTRGATSRENELTEEQVKHLVMTVDRVQRRHFNTEYRLMYGSVDEMVRKQLASTQGSWLEAVRKETLWARRARAWKRLARRLRATLSPSKETT